MKPPADAALAGHHALAAPTRQGFVLSARRTERGPGGEELGGAEVGGADSMNSVLGKVRPILEAFTSDDAALSLAELVRRSGAAKATVHRLAQELVTWGLLEREGCDYRLGLRLFELGQRVHRQRILREAVQPYMEDLLLITRETIHFAIHDSLDVVYLDKIFPHRGLNAESRVAGRLPLYCTGTGKAILAYSPPSLFVDVVRGGLKPITRHTVVSPGRLRAQLDRIRAEGIVLESEEIRLGYASLAVPVFAGGTTLVGALSITAPTYRMDASGYATALRTAALGIGRSLA
ncbi:IclR family transcriptional regulator [Streptomyces sp. Q6]|uniref:IclR family transcriptional regulator n=1 Tax=Streptomyces citrinus TaxID=3118173 RepID=A0ACD5A4N3_9ACTN